MEFFEDSFIEETESNKTEQKYSSIERVSLINGTVYLHANNIMAYIIPISSFENKMHYDRFVEFIKTKISIIDNYN